MRVDGLVELDQLGRVVENRRWNVIDGAASEPAHSHQELEVDDVDLLAAEEGPLADLCVCLGRPEGQIVAGERLAGRLLLLGIAHPHRGTDGAAEIFDVRHHPFVARGLVRVGGVQAVLTADQQQDGVRLREHGFARDLVGRHAAERRVRLEREPRVAREAVVFEVDTGGVEREAALLSATHGCIEIAELGFCHGEPS